MSEEIIPDVIASDVPEAVEHLIVEEQTVNYSEKNLAELVQLFEALAADQERMKKSKDAEILKAAFYKRLHKEKAEAGLSVPEVVEGEEEDAPVAEVATENPFIELERGFK